MLKKLLGVISISNFKEIWKFDEFFKENWWSSIREKFYQNSLNFIKSLMGGGRQKDQFLIVSG